MGIEGLLGALTGLWGSLWNYIDQNMFCAWHWNISGIGKLTKCGSIAITGDLYWTTIVAAVRLDKSYLGQLPDRVQQMVLWMLAHKKEERTD